MADSVTASGTIAVNDKGEVMVLKGDSWEAAPTAQNDAGDTRYWDGNEWQALPASTAAPAEPPQTLGQRVAAIPGRTARAVLQGAGGALSLPHNAGALLLNAPAYAWNAGQYASRLFGAKGDAMVEAPFQYGVPGQVAERVADAAGLDRPSQEPGFIGGVGRVADRIGEEVVGAATGSGAASLVGRGLGAVGEVAAPGIVRGLGGEMAPVAPGLIRSQAVPTSIPGQIAHTFTDNQVAQGASSAGSGLLGGLTAEAGGGPLAQLGASLVGGVAGGIPAGGRVAVDTGRGLAAPFTEAGREQIAGTFFNSAASDAKRAVSRLEEAGEPLVPGSMPTSAEVARDPGLLMTERGLRNLAPQGGGDGTPSGRDSFAARDIERTEARRAAVEGVAPAGAEDASTVAAAVEARVAREREALLQAQETGATTMREADAALPPSALPEVAGSTIGQHLTEAHDARRGAVGEIYNQVRPEAEIPLGPVQSAVAEAVQPWTGALAPDMPAPLRKMVERLGTHAGENPDPVATHADLQRMRSWATEESAIAAKNERGREARAYGQIVEAIDGAYSRASQPFVPEGRPITEADIVRSQAEEGAGANPDIARRLDMPPEDLAGRFEAGDAAEGLSLVQMIRRAGGLQNQGGDLLAVMGSNRAMPGLMSSRGLTLDRAAEMAFERGYIGTEGGTYTPRELLDAVDAELRGLERRYPRGQVVQQRGAGGGPSAAEDLAREVEQRGGTFRADDRDATLSSLRPAPEEGPGMLAPGEEALIPARPEAVTGAEAGLLREGAAARVQQGADFETGAAGRAARSPESGRAQAFFHAGVGGPEDAAQFVRAVGDRPQAVAALEGYAAHSLRDYATRADGTGLDPSRVARWIDTHRGALTAFPELAERFSTARGAAAEVERLVGQRQATVDEVERGVASYFLKGEDPQAVMAQVLRSNDVRAGTRAVLQLVGHDAAAVRGMRRAYVQALLDRATTTGTLPGAAGDVEGLAGAAFIRQLRQTRAAGQQLFDRASLKRLDDVASDFQSGAQWRSVGGVAGSNTGQNLSMAYLLGRVSQGQVGVQSIGGALFTNTLGRAYKWALKEQAPLVERLLIEAALDPKMQARLMRQARPGDGEALLAWGRRNGSSPVRRAIVGALARAGERGSTSGTLGVMGEDDEQQREGHASGGRVEAPDYDLAAARAAGLKPDARGHLPDTYKLPNHITFSDGSVHHGQDGAEGGHWQELDGRDRWAFTPGRTNLEQHGMDELRDYFARREPRAVLVDPAPFPGYAVGGQVAPMAAPATVPPQSVAAPQQMAGLGMTSTGARGAAEAFHFYASAAGLI